MESGYIYVLYNEVYEHYGKDVYKIGRTTNLSRRLTAYVTSYVEPSEYVYSKEAEDMENDEQVVFKKLEEYRMSKKREFFKCELSEIKEAIDSLNGMSKEEKEMLIGRNKKERRKKAREEITGIPKEVLNVMIYDRYEELKDEKIENMEIREIIGRTGVIKEIMRKVGIESMNTAIEISSEEMVESDKEIELIMRNQWDVRVNRCQKKGEVKRNIYMKGMAIILNREYGVRTEKKERRQRRQKGKERYYVHSYRLKEDEKVRDDVSKYESALERVLKLNEEADIET